MLRKNANVKIATYFRLNLFSMRLSYTMLFSIILLSILLAACFSHLFVNFICVKLCKFCHHRLLANFLAYIGILYELSIIFVCFDGITPLADVFYICYVSFTRESRTDIAF